MDECLRFLSPHIKKVTLHNTIIGKEKEKSPVSHLHISPFINIHLFFKKNLSVDRVTKNERKKMQLLYSNTCTNIYLILRFSTVSDCRWHGKV
jgi:hypothetical protein